MAQLQLYLPLSSCNFIYLSLDRHLYLRPSTLYQHYWQL
jgi:hypothetical protein